MNKRTLAFLLIVFGTLMIVYTKFNFVTTKKVVDLGPVNINKEENHPIQWSPVVGGLILIGGLVIIVSPSKK